MYRPQDKPFYYLNEGQLLALLVHGEARGESRDGQIAVMHVVRNRVLAGACFLDGSILSGGLSKWHAVMLRNVYVAKLKRYIYQFSCFQENDANREHLIDISRSPLIDKLTTKYPAWEVIRGGIPDNTGGACFYYNPAVCSPSWAKSMQVTAGIERHLFLREDKPCK